MFVLNKNDSAVIRAKYLNKFVSAEEAVSVIKSNDRIYIHSGCAYPKALVDAMSARHRELRNVEICHLMVMVTDLTSKPKLKSG